MIQQDSTRLLSNWYQRSENGSSEKALNNGSNPKLQRPFIITTLTGTSTLVSFLFRWNVGVDDQIGQESVVWSRKYSQWSSMSYDLNDRDAITPNHLLILGIHRLIWYQNIFCIHNPLYQMALRVIYELSSFTSTCLVWIVQWSHTQSLIFIKLCGKT